MLFDVKQLLEGSVTSAPVSTTVDTATLSLPHVKKATASGVFSNHAGVITIDASVTVDIDTVCDRCLTQVQRRYQLPVRHTLVRKLQSEDTLSDEYLEVEGDSIDLDELFGTEIVLGLPNKILCRDDCKGLCPKCGCNRNEHECGCVLKETDPRLAALKQLLDK